MKTINEFARKPQLVEIELDTPEIREEFGDSVVFWMKDFIDINTYFEFFKSQNNPDGQFSHILSKIILNKDGQPVLKPGEELPLNLSLAALEKINSMLGKSGTKQSMSETGNPQD